MKNARTPFAFAAAFAGCVALIIGGCNSDGTADNSILKGLEGFGDAGKGLASGLRVHGAFHKSQEQFSSLDEYHVGRAAAAQIIQQYGLYTDDAANRYVNLVGKTLAEFSMMPEVYSGYHFHILNSDEVNAFAAPGAFIFITRGLLRAAETEDELAAILAHEIGHIQNQHALAAIKKSRNEAFVGVLATEGAKTATGEYGAQVGDVLGGMTSDVLATLKNGYSREQESQADNDGVGILRRTGYDPAAMVSVLSKMEKRLKPGSKDFSSTHPKTADRIASIKSAAGGTAQPASPPRQARFDAALRAARAQ